MLDIPVELIADELIGVLEEIEADDDSEDGVTAEVVVGVVVAK